MRKLIEKYDQNRPVASLFRRLNTKIIVYFISFGFLPLLFFSILGYYLNKDMITRINSANLQLINRTYADELNGFLNHKRRLLEIYCSGSESPVNEKNLRDEFVGVLRADEQYPGSEFVKNPYVDYVSQSGVVYRGFIERAELRALIASEQSEYKHRVELPGQNISIYSSETNDSFPNLDPESAGLINNKDDTQFFISTNVKDFSYRLTTGINASAFYAELTAFRNKIFLGNAVLAVIVLILSIVYSSQITTPIHKLIRAIQHIGRGNLENRIDVQTNDEIQILANEFEIMRQKLSESYQGLEEKIQARTRQLQEAQVQISHQEKMASLGLMAAGIAHEIGNPLTSISSLAQVIRRKSSDEKIIEHVNNILKGIERISRIVRELVDFSKPSIHEAVLLDVNDIVNSAVGIIKYDRRSRHMSYQLDLDQNLPQIRLVADHLLQVLLNILINAVDASEGYGNEIRVESYKNNSSIQIDITDQGCGIPAEAQNKIFEPFYTTKEVGKGTGLGLSVSYGLIKKMNGRIIVESMLKKGSTFSVVLPIKKETEG